MKKNGKIISTALLFALVLVPLTQCKTSPAANTGQFVDTDDIRDYICVVNSSYHPNINQFLDTRIKEAMGTGLAKQDDYAALLETTRRGGHGSGFVYVDGNGDNYIITNYHVIDGAYRLSVTFESETGTKTRYLNLTVLNADAKMDLAILAFPPGQRPFRRGLSFTNDIVRSNTDVNAAGYPGMGIFNPTWEFTRGAITNPRVQMPLEEYPHIQHTALISPGNSGGPLLIPNVANPRGPGDFRVAGINTFTRSNGTLYFAIPAERVMAFIQSTFEPEYEKTALERQVDEFIALINQPATVMIYESLPTLLSGTMIAANPQADFTAVASLDAFSRKMETEPITAIHWAAAYNRIENYLWRKDHNVHAVLRSIEPNNFGGYTVRFLISDYPYRTEWVKYYGTWRVDDFAEDGGEYNDYYYFATPHPLETKVKYSLSSYRDFDWYVLDISRAGRLTVYTEGSKADPNMLLCTNPSNADTIKASLIGTPSSDIDGRNYNARVSGNVTRPGKVYVRITYDGLPDNNPRIGDYTLIAQLE
jgi:S1-C subfamily serine protease